MEKKVDRRVIKSKKAIREAFFELLQENRELQKECKHEFESDGYCIYCDFYDAAHDEEEIE